MYGLVLILRAFSRWSFPVALAVILGVGGILWAINTYENASTWLLLGAIILVALIGVSRFLYTFVAEFLYELRR